MNDGGERADGNAADDDGNDQGSPGHSAAPGRAEPAVSVVVPTRNRAQQVARCVAAALVDTATAEVVVVDDGSTDGTADFLAERFGADARLRVIAGPGRGAAAARHVGVQAAAGPVVLLVDDDVVLSPGAVAAHQRHHAGGDGLLVVLGAMPVRPQPDGPGRFATALYGEEYDRHVARWEEDPSLILRALWAGHLSLRRELCLEAGARSASFPPVNHNDRELGLQLLEGGAHAIFDPRLLATHEHERSARGFLADARRQGAGKVVVHGRHPLTLGPFDPISVVGAVPSWTKPVLRLLAGCPPVAAAMSRLLLGAVELAGRARWRRGERQVAKLARRFELLRGALDAERGQLPPR